MSIPSLDNKSPVEVFTGLPCASSLQEFRIAGDVLQSIQCDSAEITGFLEQLRTSIQCMHCKMGDQKLNQRLLNKKKKRGESIADFSVGDYVLRSRVDESVETSSCSLGLVRIKLYAQIRINFVSVNLFLVMKMMCTHRA